MIAATFAAKGQQEAYIQLTDAGAISTNNGNGIVLEGTETGRFRAFMFNPKQPRVYFMPLDTAKGATNEFQLIDSMIPDGGHLVIQYFKASTRTRSLPEIVQNKDIPNLPPFTLSDGDLIVIELRRTPAATSSQK